MKQAQKLCLMKHLKERGELFGSVLPSFQPVPRGAKFVNLQGCSRSVVSLLLGSDENLPVRGVWGHGLSFPVHTRVQRHSCALLGCFGCACGPGGIAVFLQMC